MSKKQAPPYWNEAKRHLARKDKVLGGIIGSYEGEMMVSMGDPFLTLARSITSQQISVKAADTIWNRMEAHLGSVAPETLAASNAEGLRAQGLSRQKILYLQSLAEHFLTKGHEVAAWPALGDDELMKELVALKGIGRWTAEMYMIFHLGRPDVLPIADIGLQKAVARHYGKGKRLPPEKMKKLAEPWRPYRSVATWYLWRALDPVAVAY